MTIGVVAMRWAALLDQHERARGHGLVSWAGRARLVEVYPALAAAVWGLATSETADYKRGDQPCSRTPGVAARAH